MHWKQEPVWFLADGRGFKRKGSRSLAAESVIVCKMVCAGSAHQSSIGIPEIELLFPV